MSKVSCPYCYRSFAPSRLNYQCTGRGTPGKPGCKPQRDEVRQQLTGYNGLTRHTFPADGRLAMLQRKAICPVCLSETGIRACPDCHTPMPANFGDSASPLIAMAGAKSTGKSVYTTVLAHELRSGLRRRFHADVRLSGDRQGSADSPLAWLNANVDAVFGRGQLPEGTAQTNQGIKEPLVFEWRQAKKRAGRSTYRTSYLSFYDTAGEDLTHNERIRDQAYLGAAGAVIMLLDPFMLPDARDRITVPDGAIDTGEATIDVVGRLTELMRESHGVRGSRKIKVPTAVAFAKIDAFFDVLNDDHPILSPSSTAPVYDETAGRSMHEHVRALLHEWGGDEIDSHLESNYATFRYFAVSALGAPPDYGTKKVAPGGVRPHRVEEPLVWLLNHFDVIDRRR